MIKFFRIDDRLIHGQIATTWLRHTQVNSVLIVDDKTASNNMLVSLQRMSCPKDIELNVVKVEDAKAKLDEIASKDVFILCSNLPTAKKVFEMIDFRELNVGNIGYKENSRNLINRIFVTKEDEEALQAILDMGVKAFAQMLPNEPVDLINKI